MTWITLASGRRLDFVRPVTDAIDIEKIAVALSRTGRWANQTERFYSVAQHSVVVSRYVEDRGGSRLEQLVGLLHDTPEAFTGDVTRPFKHMLGDKFQEVEAALWQCISIKLLGEFVKIPAIVKYCDDLALATEGRDLWKASPCDDMDCELPKPDGQSIVPLGMEQAATMFMARYNLLAYCIPERAAS